MNIPTQLPMPERLEPKATNKTLAASVRRYFYAVYNSDPKFKTYLASVGNKDAITGNRGFDRHVAVEFLKDAARAASDDCFKDVIDVEIYKHLSHEISKWDDLKLRYRRLEFQRFTQQAAE